MIIAVKNPAGRKDIAFETFSVLMADLRNVRITYTLHICQKNARAL